MQVAKTGIAKNFFKFSIHFPGLGRILINKVGNNPTRVKGRAYPTARAKKIGKYIYTGCVILYPSAAPIKGAEQGLAIRTANNPVKKEFSFSFLTEMLANRLNKGELN